jgi:hypothetical protein
MRCHFPLLSNATMPFLDMRTHRSEPAFAQ